MVAKKKAVKRSPVNKTSKPLNGLKRIRQQDIGLLLSVLLFGFLILSGQSAKIETIVFWAHQSFHPANPEPDTSLTFLGIDQETTAKFGEWPWSQKLFREVLNTVSKQQPEQLLVLDQPFPQVSPEALAIIQTIETKQNADLIAKLHQTLDTSASTYQRFPNVGYGSFSGANQSNTSFMPLLPKPEMSNEKFQKLWLNFKQWFTHGPYLLSDAGLFAFRPESIQQFPVFRGPDFQTLPRPLLFQNEAFWMPGLALSFWQQNNLADQSFKFNASHLSINDQILSYHENQDFWPSLHPSWVENISLLEFLQSPEQIDLSDQTVFIGLEQSFLPSNAQLEAALSAQISTQALTYSPWYTSLISLSLMALIALYFNQKRNNFNTISFWITRLAMVLILILLNLIIMRYWNLWLQPGSISLFIIVTSLIQWFNDSPASPQTQKALHATRLQLAQSQIIQRELDSAFTTLKKNPFNISSQRVFESLLDQCKTLKNDPLEKKVLSYIQKYKPNFSYQAKPLKTNLDKAKLAPAIDQTAVMTEGELEPSGSHAIPKPEGIDRYELKDELGRGAMAIVYRAIDQKLGREIALKVLQLGDIHADSKNVEIHRRFMQEARAAARLNHPNIVTVYDVGEDGRQAWIAMDFLKGDDLSRYTQSKSLLALPRLMKVMVAVAEALDFAHQHQVVHRDIKPANILYHPNTGDVTVTDFGVASLQDASQTRTGTVLGSPSYMSPEQVQGKNIDGRADIYSLGVTLYQLCTGQLPFAGESLANVMYKITQAKFKKPTAIRADLPEPWEKIIIKAMHKQVKKRHQNGAELASELRALYS